MNSSTLDAAILPLPPQVAAQIRSSAAVTTLHDVVLQLLCNSIDAQSILVDISVDFARGSCVVGDDGGGIPAAEFGPDGGLGKPFYTSKLQNAVSYGYAGKFLSALTALSVLTVTSRQASERTQSTITFHQSRPIARRTDKDLVGERGTRVTVRNLFGNMPVRVKHRASSDDLTLIEKEWDYMVLRVTAVVLASPRAVTVSLKNERTGRHLQLRGALPSSQKELGLNQSRKYWKKRSQIGYALSILSQASLVPRSCWASWVPVSAKTSLMTVKGAISLDPAASKQVQFISLGIRPIPPEGPYSVVYDEINRVIALSKFGAIEDPVASTGNSPKVHNGIEAKRPKIVRKGIDRWAMFCLWVNLTAPEGSNIAVKEPDVVALCHLQAISQLLQAVVTSWLEEHHFRQPRSGRVLVRSKEHEPPAASADEEGLPKDNRSRLSEPPSHLVTSPDCGSSEPDWEPVVVRGGQHNKEAAETTASMHSISSKRTQPSSNLVGGSFSSWSRIKSGMPSVLSTSLSSTSRVSGDVQAIPDENSRRIEQSCTCTHIDVTRHEGAEPITSPTNPKAQQADDDLIRWQHPASKETYLLNTRSGVMFKSDEVKRIARRPLTAPSASSNNTPHRYAAKLERPNTSDSSSSTWISGLIDRWENPVFRSSERQIPHLNHAEEAVENVDVDPLRNGTASNNIRFSVHSLRTAEIVRQVDRKFILLKVAIATDKRDIASDCAHPISQALVLIDQHAADERCKVESLFRAICSCDPNDALLRSNLGHQPESAAVILAAPIAFIVNPKEALFLEEAAPMFARWGVLYDLNLAEKSGSSDQERDRRVTVRTLPCGIYERCTADVALVIELLRGEAWKYQKRKVRALDLNSTPDEGERHPWLRHIGACPQGIVDMLISRACRSAVMFNDTLSMDECRTLVDRLAECAFPFQCAHGRPSVVPLVDIGLLDDHDNGAEISSLSTLDVGPVDHQERPGFSQHGFVKAFQRWRRDG